jgi:predicted DNA repair protein MutK
MFLVGGSILVHGLPGAHYLIEAATHATAALPGVGVALGAISPLLIDGLAGITAGALVLAGIKLGKRLSR